MYEGQKRSQYNVVQYNTTFNYDLNDEYMF